MPTETDEASVRACLARNRQRQRELYGCALGDRVRRLTATLGVTQARLAQALGVSPAMLSQLASARRVKIGDPAVLARLRLLDHRCGTAAQRGPIAVDALLDEVARVRPQWSALEARGARPPTPVDALRAVAPPARLAAAAGALGPAFPEVAAVLRQAATRPAAPRHGRPHAG
jgi:transcriptional regulator with XRE-family HTH domain